MTNTTSATPVRCLLRDDSALQPKVKVGLRAVKAGHRDYFDEGIRTAFADSLDADEALRPGHDQENRWDYLLGARADSTGDRRRASFGEGR